MTDTEKSKQELLKELEVLRAREAELQELDAAGEQEQVLLNALLSHLPDRIYIKDRDSRFVRVGKAMAEQYGFSGPDEAVGKSDFDFFSKEHAQKTRDEELRLIESGEPLTVFGKKESWSDGRENWVTTTKLPWRDEQGETIGVFGLTRDVTKIKQAEQALRDAETLYRSLVDNIAYSVFCKDKDSRLTSVNKRYCEIEGQSREELLGKTDHDIFPAELADKYRADDLRVMESGETLNIVERHQTPDGERIHVQVVKAPLRDVEGQVVGTQGIFWDVTEKKKAEETLEKLAAIIRSTTDAVFGTNMEGVILSWNPGAERIYGYAPEEVVGTAARLLRTESERDGANVILEKVKQGEHVSDIETVHVTKDGREIDVSLSVSPLEGASGGIIGLAVVARDVTAAKQNRLAARELAAIVESSSEAIISQTLQGEITTWNPAAEKMYGWTAADVIGETTALLTPHEHTDQELILLGQLARGESLQDAEMVHQTKQGELLHVTLSASPIRDRETDRVTGASIIARLSDSDASSSDDASSADE
ncbi:MAG: PAS domain S-box protein [Planctomycetales bacterium]